MVYRCTLHSLPVGVAAPVRSVGRARGSSARHLVGRAGLAAGLGGAALAAYRCRPRPSSDAASHEQFTGLPCFVTAHSTTASTTAAARATTAMAMAVRTHSSCARTRGCDRFEADLEQLNVAHKQWRRKKRSWRAQEEAWRQTLAAQTQRLRKALALALFFPA